MSSVFKIMKPHDSILRSIKIPQKLLCGPGPSNMRPEVSEVLSKPLLGHLHPEFTQIMDETKEGIRYLFQTSAKWTLAISGTGHCALEAAAFNLLERGEKALVCTNGIWGERFADVVDRLGIQAVPLKKPPGQIFCLDEIEKGLADHSPSVVFVTHGESSAGTMQPLEGLGPLCHKYGALLLVDAVVTAGGAPLFMDQWELDLVYTAGQKCLGCPPGICPIALSDRARDKVMNRSQRVPSFYLDLVQLANYWGCDDGPRRYHHTAPISLVYGLRESLRLIAEEGLSSLWQRHAQSAQHLYAGLTRLGLELLVANPDHRVPCVTTVRVPQGVDWLAVTRAAMASHKLEVSGGLGPTAGHVWRIGLMGVNATVEIVDRILVQFGEAYKSVAKI